MQRSSDIQIIITVYSSNISSDDGRKKKKKKEKKKSFNKLKTSDQDAIFIFWDTRIRQLLVKYLILYTNTWTFFYEKGISSQGITIIVS